MSPSVLVRQQVFVDRQRALQVQARLVELAGDDGEAPIADPVRFFTEVLEWPAGILTEPPDSLTVALPEYEDHLRPTFAVPAPDGGRGSAPVAPNVAPGLQTRGND